jgi:hypothetical protein
MVGAPQFAAHFDNPRTWTGVLKEHRKIIGALAARDPRQARHAMHNHLLRAHNRWARQVDRGARFSAFDARKQPSGEETAVTALSLTQSGPGE